MPAPDCRLGVDVGGTNTDAVIMDAADRVLAKAKVPGTADITSGIVAAIDAVLGTPGVEPQRISHVMLGTTHATNAVLERRNLRRVAVQLKPGADLREVLQGSSLKLSRSVAANFFILEAAGPAAAMSEAQRLAARPDVLVSCPVRRRSQIRLHGI